MRYDIISDTHGWLSEELLRQLQGADVIVHAGDICSPSDYVTLQNIAPVHLCLGNNDWDNRDYSPRVRKKVRFESEGFRWQICHYERKLDLSSCDIAVCGHTHRPFIERDQTTGTIVINPGSPSLPRNGYPSMVRLVVNKGKISELRIIKLDEKNKWERLAQSILG